MKLTITIFLAMLCVAISFSSRAQQRTLSPNIPEPMIMNGNASTRMPGKYKKVRKKELKEHSPFTGYSKAVGYVYKDGSKIIYYHANIDWVNVNQGIKMWDVAYQLAENFGEFKFHESGFCRSDQGKGALTYYLKITSMNNNDVAYKLLTFSELDGKLLYGLYIFPEGYRNPTNISDDILRNQSVAHF
jgi:hypothetical protein